MQEGPHPLLTFLIGFHFFFEEISSLKFATCCFDLDLICHYKAATKTVVAFFSENINVCLDNEAAVVILQEEYIDS